MPSKKCAECGGEYTGRGRSLFCSSTCYFWSLYDRTGGPDACWLWTGHVHKRDGYGITPSHIAAWGKAHRCAYKLTYGDPGTLDVCHSCDNRLCGNPAHLWPGTRLDNMRDAAAKGRVGGTKLDVAAVREIRATVGQTKAQAREMAERLGVGLRYVYAVRAGRGWRHVA